MITGEANIQKVRWLALRQRLRLEIEGIRFRGRPTSVIIREEMAVTTRNKLKLLMEYEDWLELKHLTFKRITESVKLTQVQEEKHEIQNCVQRREVHS